MPDKRNRKEVEEADAERVVAGGRFEELDYLFDEEDYDIKDQESERAGIKPKKVIDDPVISLTD